MPPRRAASARRRVRARPDREQQLVIVAAAQRFVDRILAARVEHGARRGSIGSASGVDGHADAARLGDLLQSVGQPVAEVHARGGGAVAAQMQAETDARFGPQIAQSSVGSRQSQLSLRLRLMH